MSVDVEAIDVTSTEQYKRGFDDGFAAGLAAAVQQLKQYAEKHPLQATVDEMQLDSPIHTLGLTKRVRNVLWRYDIKTVRQIYRLDKPEAQPEKMRGFGVHSLNEINAALLRRGYPALKVETLL
jgi:DNA-directed RNA polymerase alpha subunit